MKLRVGFSIPPRLLGNNPSELIPRSYYGVWAAIHRAIRRAELDPQIQTCHGFRKYFENALDDANIDHEKKMIIEGHFAGTRATHYTDRDIKHLREVYGKSYPFIQIEPVVHASASGRDIALWNRFAEVESQLSRQRVLEAKLTALEDDLRQMKELRKVQFSRDPDKSSAADLHG